MKITTSKTKKNIEKFANHHYIKMWLLVDHYNDITTSKVSFQLITTMTKKDFRCSDFTYGIKKDHNVKNQKYLFKQTTYGILPMVTKACGGPGGLGQGQLGQVRLGQARLGYITLVRLDQVRLSQVRKFLKIYLKAKNAIGTYAIGSQNVKIRQN